MGNNIEVNPSLDRIFATTDVHATSLLRSETFPHRTSSKHPCGSKPDLSGDLVDKVSRQYLRHEAFDSLCIIPVNRTCSEKLGLENHFRRRGSQNRTAQVSNQNCGSFQFSLTYVIKY